jgi:glycosyltransferase involved in cell wall biosynthesis
MEQVGLPAKVNEPPMTLGDAASATEPVRGPASAGSGDRLWPRITLVTPVYNGEMYLEETIRSVVHQGYPNLEYILVDDGSTDGSAEIIKKYERSLSWWVSQPNQGLYGALNTGFSRATGEVLGWLNANDKLHTNGLFVVGSVFSAFAEVEWITGRPTVFNDEGMTVEVQDLPRWSRSRFLAGANRHIQQESTFWRRGLWQRAGGCMETAYRAEGDFELWLRLFRHARLYPVDGLIGGWRFHPNSLSHGDLERYDRNCGEIIEKELSRTAGYGPLKLFMRIDRAIRRVPKVRGIWQRVLVNNLRRCLYRVPGPDWPPVIEFKDGKWSFRG